MPFVVGTVVKYMIDNEKLNLAAAAPTFFLNWFELFFQLISSIRLFNYNLCNTLVRREDWRTRGITSPQEVKRESNSGRNSLRI